ncbi:hypothetical protein VTL71DRAFT_8670 [Oculimacula yallundae]|uniref:Uncharacterized protein n=1 Tax=Oculimacula yallundae TaxID=86028 RepID=A0ABR4CY91_9HELO
MLSLLVLSCLSINPTFAAPITNTTSSNATASSKDFAPSWVSEPGGRGTWKLLYSCVFTLTLCVWTSVHLNVPGYGESTWHIYRRKTKWVVMALFAPEFVVFCAFQQWFLARMFLKEVQMLHDWVPPGSEKKQNGPKAHQFDMSYAMFTVMGGFAVDIEHLHNTVKRATLTPDGILLLAQHGHLFYVEPDAIADKSKANILAKSLVCVQVLWVAGQAIERKVAGLPISLLEYHTLVHVVCALVMYVLWFKKPYDIQYPTVVSSEEFPDALAYIVASTKWKGNSGFTTTREKHWKDFMHYSSDPEFYRFETSIPSFDSFHHLATLGLDDPHDLDPRVRNVASQVQNTTHSSHPTGTIFTCIPADSSILTLRHRQALHSGLGPLLSQNGQVHVSEKDVLRLDLAAEFITKIIGMSQNPRTLPEPSYNNPRYGVIHSHEVFAPGTIRPYGNTLIALRALNTAGSMEMYDRAGSREFAILFIALMSVLSAYGAIHLSASHSSFPSTLEMTLWRSSCYTLLGAVALLNTYLLLVWIAVIQFEGQLPMLERVLSWVGSHLFEVGTIPALPYVAARIFLVVESFVSTRHMQNGVYQTPDTTITNYIPHI